MKTLLLRVLVSLVVAVFVVSGVPLCVAGDGGVPPIDFLREHPKLIEPALVLEDFVQGKATTGVIVNLTQPPRVPERGNFRDLGFRQQLQEGVRAAQERVISRVDPSHVRVSTRFVYVFGFAAEVTLEGLTQLVEMDEVMSVNKDRILTPHLAQGIPLMNAMEVRSTYNGSGLAIAICDTGIDTSHPMLGGGGFPNAKVIGGYDTGDNDADPRPDPVNGEPHGTACAGIAAGSLGTVGDYIGGVAYNATLYAVKISTGTGGSATEANMIEGWEWCITHQNDDPANPIMIISTSFGGSYFTSPCDAASPSMTAAAANAVAAGMTLFVSSGNEGFCDGTAWPACITHVNAVGAVYDAPIGYAGWCISPDSCTGFFYDPCYADWACEDASTAADVVTCYSNSANFLSLFAPSNNAYTADIVGAGGYTAGDYTTSFGGTSAACPYAAGAAACLQSWAKATRGSFLTPAEVRERLTSTGDPITDTKQGHISITKPRVNLGAAVGGAAYTVLHKEGALWRAGEGWTTTTPPYYPGYPYAVDVEYRPDGTYGILHIDGAIWYSDTGWVLSSPPYYVGTGYARDLEMRGGFGWEQPVSSVNTAAYANQDFETAYDAYDIFMADDFTTEAAVAIRTIYVPGDTWNLGGPLTNASALHWQIYADAGGVPDGDPSGGGNPPVWSLSLPPGDSQVTLSTGVTGYLSNVALTLNTPLVLPAGTYWLVFYPRMDFDPHGQYGRHVSDTTNGHIAKVINPAGGFGFPTVWTNITDPSTHGLTQQDCAFRLETEPSSVILHRDGALWRSDAGWLFTTPPYYAGSNYARALEFAGDSYVILHRDGGLYHSSSGWIMETPPFYPGSDWAVDLKVR